MTKLLKNTSINAWLEKCRLLEQNQQLALDGAYQGCCCTTKKAVSWTPMMHVICVRMEAMGWSEMRLTCGGRGTRSG